MHSYEDFVSSRFKEGHEILPTLTPSKLSLLHAVFGLGTEVGELQDAVKKHVFYNAPLNVENIEEELGDIEFYLQAIYTSLAKRGVLINRERVIATNVEKLSKRYPQGYTDHAAAERADKATHNED